MITEAILYLEANDFINAYSLFFVETNKNYIIVGSVEEVNKLLKENSSKIISYSIEYNKNSSLMPLFDFKNTKARIEPGAIIRSGAVIADSAIILMGAVVNTKASIGDNTMIDMNSVIGSGAQIGADCHIGAGAVVAGVMEPISNPVIIEDNCFIGANATIIGGVHVQKGAIIGAGSVLTKDALPYRTYAGVPAKEINQNQNWNINKELRK